MKLKNMLLTIAAAVLVGCAPVQPASQQQESTQNSTFKIVISRYHNGAPCIYIAVTYSRTLMLRISPLVNLA